MKCRRHAAELQVLAKKPRLDEKDDTILNRLEAASENEEITFTWELDFPEIFFEAGSASGHTDRQDEPGEPNQGQMELTAPAGKRGGFDIIVGNPPFVTARNEEKRKAYFERWP